MADLPVDFSERMKALTGEDFEKFILSEQQKPVRGFRVNTDKISVSEFEKISRLSEERIPFTETGYYLIYDKIGSHPYHHSGMIYVQEPSAMMPAECVRFSEGMRVLDMCASPGGKSTQIKNKIGSKGILVSNEIIPSRCKTLTGNIERLGLRNVITTCTDTKRLSEIYRKTFDVVCVDAPCSGEGMFRKDGDAVKQWSPENVKMCAERQKSILDNAAEAVKNGGCILYSTCTFSLEENEMQIDRFLSEHSDFRLEEVNERVREYTEDGIFFDGCKTENISLCRRFYPHTGRGEGQFAAVLRSTLPEGGNTSGSDILTPCRDRAVFDFLDSTLTRYDRNEVKMYKNTPVIFSDNFFLPAPVAFSCGVTVGEIRKGYIQPHHQLFMAMGSDFKQKICLKSDSIECKKYLKGETIPVSSENGYTAVLIDGCAVGGGKAVNGTLKNHYPKGLRDL